jgi:ABC-2 type transport system ATP-binding protein
MTATFECKGLSKSFGSKTALDNVDISLAPGRVVGLLGPNGSGKTTLMKLANGLLSPSAGEILICGNKPGVESKAVVSYLPDKNSMPQWMNAEQLMDFFQDFYADFERDRANTMLDKLGLDKTQKLSQMSKGTREKVQLIMVMSRKAKLYLLDEPIGGVDPATRDYILDTIIRNYDPEAVVIISTHLISDVEKILDEVVFINQGKVTLQASVDDIREQYGMSVDDYFREVFKC